MQGITSGDVMETNITIIVDNKSVEGIQGEWGLSILIRYEGKNILLDAGASNLFRLRKILDIISLGIE